MSNIGGWLAKYFHSEPVNRRVVVAMMPCVAASVYFFGWRSLALVIWTALVGVVSEYVFTRRRNEPVSESVLVSSTIFALIMPPSVPWHVAGIGIVFAVAMAKQVFGGFGRNIFNPAMSGRCFVYICFPVAMTAVWPAPAEGTWGALSRWSTVSDADSVTGATPMAHLKAGRLRLTDSVPGERVSKMPFAIEDGKTEEFSRAGFHRGLLVGRVAGTMGVTSVIAILVGGIYLFATGTANRAIILSTILTYALLNEVLFRFGVRPVPGALTAVMGGGFLFGAFFMATDPVSAPKTRVAKIFFGMLIGTLTLVIRNFSIFNGGLMFSILMANMFAPIMDHVARQFGGWGRRGHK